MLQRIDLALQELITKAQAQGKLTYEEVSALLPDEIEGTDRIDAVLSAIDGLGIELVDGPDAHRRELAEPETNTSAGDRSFVLLEHHGGFENSVATPQVRTAKGSDSLDFH